MRALLDVNVLIALFDADHIQHERAHAWFEANQDQGWASCPLTENGLVRILCHPHYSRVIHRTAAEVVADLHAVSGQTKHEFWPDDLTLRDSSIIRTDRIKGPRQITDIYLLALAVKHGGCLATFDGSIPVDAVVGTMPGHLVLL
ncbi:Ribonuclease VapC44 [Gammaproteobacteria bacterium]